MNESNNLVKVVDGTPMADSRTVAEVFEKRHDDVLKAIRNMECSEEFRVRNFAETPYIHPQNGQTYIMYEMTRDGFTFLAMSFTGAKAALWKEAYIEAFNKLERAASSHFQVPQTLPEALRLAADESERANRAEAALEQAQPKIEAHERIAEADGSLCITDAAKALQMRPKDLFGYLSTNGWIYKRAGNSHWLGYQSKVTTGLLEHKVTTVLRPDGSERMTEQVRVTPKGLSKLALLIPPSAEAA